MTGEAKVVQYLNEAHALEVALVQTLTAHVAITPRGEYRDLLERHLQETRDQATRIEQRLSDLGESRNPLQQVYGIAQNAVMQALAVGKLPIDLIRGTGGEEKLVKNARDELTSEALEIATYDSIEALAEAVGDSETADLARDHREQEQRTFDRLRELIPVLTRDVVSADVEGSPTYDVTTTGAADAARSIARRGQRAAEQVQAEAQETAGEVGAAARAAAADVSSSAQSATESAEETVEQAAERVSQRAKDTVRSIPGEQEIEGEIRGARSDGSDLAIADYDSLTVEQILPKLKILPQLELAKIDAYEREHRGRKRVLDRIRRLRESADRQPAGSR